MQFLMHESGRYGHLCNVKGIPLQPEEVSSRCGVKSLGEYMRLLAELDYEVLCRNSKGLIFDPDMIHEEEKRVQKEKEQSATRNRQKKFREQHRYVTGDVTPPVTEMSRVTPDPEHVFVLKASSLDSSTKETSDSKTVVALPEWMPGDKNEKGETSWEEYLGIRKKLKAPNTPRALRSLINQLEELKNHGWDPKIIIANAIVGGWKFFYEPKENGNGINRQNSSTAPAGGNGSGPTRGERTQQALQSVLGRRSGLADALRENVPPAGDGRRVGKGL